MKSIDQPLKNEPNLQPVEYQPKAGRTCDGLVDSRVVGMLARSCGGRIWLSSGRLEACEEGCCQAEG